MADFLAETIAALEYAGKYPSDVRWVGSRDGKLALSWQAFELIAKGVEYDSGFGSQKIASDLVVVGADWWLDRHEYDGAECWQFHVKPLKGELARPFHKVKVNGGGWESLREINRSED